MQSIRQELETPGTARWYRHASGARRAGAWAERVRDYAALRAILDGHAAAGHAAAGPAAGTAQRTARRREQPPIQLPGLLKLVAEYGHYGGAEPVYRRYPHSHPGRAHHNPPPPPPPPPPQPAPPPPRPAPAGGVSAPPGGGV